MGESKQWWNSTKVVVCAVMIIVTFFQLTKRSVQHMDFLTLDQIQALSAKNLVNMFSELSSNEMTKNYTYACYLIPSKCKESYTSFGNESKARSLMREHLVKHVAVLTKQASGTLYFIYCDMLVTKTINLLVTYNQ